MEFIIGYIVGILNILAVFVILTFLRAGIETRIKVFEKQMYQAGPQPRGAIFVPEDEADAVRREHIEKNQKEGKDTPVSELE